MVSNLVQVHQCMIMILSYLRKKNIIKVSIFNNGWINLCKNPMSLACSIIPPSGVKLWSKADNQFPINSTDKKD